MMPEIKFRAWLKKEKKMIYPCVLDFLHKTWSAEKDLCGSFDEIELMQFTGKFDDNYYPIYEGDIVEYVTGLRYYKTTHTNHKVTVQYKDGRFYPFPDADIITIKVVGNVYENKNLLDTDV